MNQVVRFDQMPLSAERDGNGFLVAPACFTRVGVFYYVNDDGSVRAELRKAEEVFSPEAFESMKMLPVTNLHPPEMLNPDNTKQYLVGMSSEQVQRDGDIAKGYIKITDGAAIADVESGERQEMSCGYVADLDYTPGVWEGIRYDAIQRNIRYNHIAIVPKGRAGSQCRIKTDSADVRFGCGKPTEDGGHSMPKIRIDGIDVEISEQGKQVVEKELNKRDMSEKEMMDKYNKLMDEMKELKKQMDGMGGKKDAAEAEVAKLKEEIEKVRADANNPEIIEAKVKARSDLIEKCKPLVKEGFKFDGVSELEIKKAVVANTYPAIKLDEASEDRIDGLFEGALLSSGSTSQHSKKIDNAMSNVTDADDDAKFYKEHKDSVANAWKKTLAK